MRKGLLLFFNFRKLELERLFVCLEKWLNLAPSLSFKHWGSSSSSFPLAGNCWGTLTSQPIRCCGCRRIFCTVYNGLPLLPIHSCIFGYIYVHSLILKIFDVFEPCFLWCCSLHSPVVCFFSPVYKAVGWCSFYRHGRTIVACVSVSVPRLMVHPCL